MRFGKNGLENLCGIERCAPSHGPSYFHRHTLNLLTHLQRYPRAHNRKYRERQHDVWLCMMIWSGPKAYTRAGMGDELGIGQRIHGGEATW